MENLRALIETQFEGTQKKLAAVETLITDEYYDEALRELQALQLQIADAEVKTAREIVTTMKALTVIAVQVPFEARKVYTPPVVEEVVAEEAATEELTAEVEQPL